MKQLIAGIAFACLALAQPSVNASLGADNAVPFGTVSGQLLLLDDNLVFVDSLQPESSFVVNRGSIDSLTAAGPEVTVQTSRSVRNRSGEVRRLSFRITKGEASAATRWFAAGSTGASRTSPADTSVAAPASANLPQQSVSAGPAPTSSPADSQSYEARHDHTFGSCSGRLVISPSQVAYESTDNVSHSRRWEYSSIKEITQKNPYEIEIRPFTGGDYKLNLGGSGMDPAMFKQLVDRVTSARSSGGR